MADVDEGDHHQHEDYANGDRCEEDVHGDLIGGIEYCGWFGGGA